MNGDGESRAHGPGLNGACDFYYEAAEGAQGPGGLLLSPAAFINPAQYASVLEGRFKQLQGERPARGPGSEGPEPSRRVAPGPVRAPPPVLEDRVRGEEFREAGRGLGPWKKGRERGGSARCPRRRFGREAPVGGAGRREGG